MRRKALPKHMRWRYRYVLVEWRGNVNAGQVMAEIRRILGELTCRLADVRVVGAGVGHVVIRLRREYVWHLRAALALSHVPAPLRVGLVSGTLAALRRKSKSPINV